MANDSSNNKPGIFEKTKEVVSDAGHKVKEVFTGKTPASEKEHDKAKENADKAKYHTEQAVGSTKEAVKKEGNALAEKAKEETHALGEKVEETGHDINQALHK